MLEAEMVHPLLSKLLERRCRMQEFKLKETLKAVN